MKLDDYGWTEELADAFAPLMAQGLVPGRVIVQLRGGVRVVCADGEVEARAAGHLQITHDIADRPTAGDWVALEPRPAPEPALIQQVLPRRTAFIRRAIGRRARPQVVAANVDVALLVTSMNADFSLRRLERYLATTYESGADPVVLLTKADLADAPDRFLGQARAIAGEAPVLVVSARSGQGLADLAQHLRPGRTGALLGMSGAGKSTLVNALAGDERMMVGAVREDDARGRHTTTHRELVRLPSGALLLDTPGMRELGLWDAEGGVAAAFDDIEALAAQCRFRDCAHAGEPGCAVRTALAEGRLDADRWAAYQKLHAELATDARGPAPRVRSSAHRKAARPKSGGRPKSR